VQRRLRRHPGGRRPRGRVRLRRQRAAFVLRSVLVRAEGRLHPADAAVPRHQEHPSRPHAAGLPLQKCAGPAGQGVQHRPDHHPRGRPQGPAGLSLPASGALPGGPPAAFCPPPGSAKIMYFYLILNVTPLFTFKNIQYFITSTALF